MQNAYFLFRVSAPNPHPHEICMVFMVNLSRDHARQTGVTMRFACFWHLIFIQGHCSKPSSPTRFNLSRDRARKRDRPGLHAFGIYIIPNAICIHSASCKKKPDLSWDLHAQGQCSKPSSPMGFALFHSEFIQGSCKKKPGTVFIQGQCSQPSSFIGFAWFS